MRLVFAGTPEFALRALDALHAAGHDIAAVFTQPDRPAGRGRKLSAAPVALRAQELKLPLFQPLKFDAAAQEQLRELRPEVMVVVAYGLILPQAALDIPTHGCLNIHASLLPRWRGAAPIQRAIQAGDSQSGVTIMLMDAGLDTGPMLLTEAAPITEATTGGELHDRLAEAGAALIVQALHRLARGELAATPQPSEGATYARKLAKPEAQIAWSRPAEEIARTIRAFNPVPVAWTRIDGERLRLIDARAESGAGVGAPGAVLAADAHGIRVGAAGGVVVLTELQFAGGRVISAAQAAQGRDWVGKILGS
ncbi:MAG TPA: methionyl-tRNA formyltransferase [Candidatus Binatia bacterium]|nr:methionyl-tRNA formyltransferase [Candidatus Binatia bacterium]